VGEILAAMERKLPLLQVLVGPRQVGKTVAAGQVEKRLGWPSVVASADAALPHPPEWIETQWRHFVVSQGVQDWAVEVKSGRGGKVSGMAAFRKRYPKAKAWLVGATGIKLEEFLSHPATEWFR